MKSHRLRDAVAVLALVVISSAVGLALVEGVVRLVSPQQLIIFRYDVWHPVKVFGHRHWDNVNTIVNVGEGTVHFRTDENGYRIDRDGDPHPNGADVEILALGDSFLEGLTVESESTMVEVMRRDLESQLHESVRVDNTGVGGWDPNQYLLQARASLPRRQYDLAIVFVYVSNDIISQARDYFPPRPYSARYHFRFPHALTRAELTDSILRPLNEILSARLESYILFKKVFRTQLARLGLRSFYFPSSLRVATRNGPRWGVTADVCAKIAATCGRYHVPVFFVLIPSNYQVEPGVFDQYVRLAKVDPAAVDIDQPQELLTREFAERHLRLVDPLALMKAREAAGAHLYGRVNKHLSSAGHRVLAEAITPVARAILAPADSTALH